MWFVFVVNKENIVMFGGLLNIKICWKWIKRGNLVIRLLCDFCFYIGWLVKWYLREEKGNDFY